MFAIGVCRLLGWLPLYCLHPLYILSSLSFLCFSPLFFTILFYSIPVWAVACGVCRCVFYRCVSVAWEIPAGSLWNASVCVFAAVYSGLILQSSNFGTLTLSFVTLDFHLDGVFFRLDVAWNHCPNFFWFAIARSCASRLFFSML